MLSLPTTADLDTVYTYTVQCRLDIRVDAAKRTPRRLLFLTFSTATKELLKVKSEIKQPIVGKTYFSKTSEADVISKRLDIETVSDRSTKGALSTSNLGNLDLSGQACWLRSKRHRPASVQPFDMS